MNRIEQKERWGWYLFDFANTSFTVVVVTVAYAVYFREFVVGDATLGDLYWGLGNSVSMLIVGITSPWLGAISDSTAKRKHFIGIYALICIIATGLMVTVGAGDIWWGIILFVFANIGFQGGLVFYNAFLPQISPAGKIGAVSGIGFAWGYAGALCSLLIAMPFASRADQMENMRLLAPVFPLSALFFLIFAIPFFLWVRERRPAVTLEVKPWREGWQRVRTTIKQLHHFRQTARFLLAYFIYSDGLNTVIAFGGIYAVVTLGFSAVQVLMFFALLQLAAIAGAWGFGLLTDRWGAKPVVELTLAIWLVMTVWAFFVQSQSAFFGVGALAGIAMGSSQAASRTLMAALTPPSREAEFYGFYGLCGRFSAILGTVLFGIVSSVMHSQRWAVLSIAPFFAAGWLLL
ncbi:MFS transporter, partial [Candidatus Zixiibacteriota bacterium]